MAFTLSTVRSIIILSGLQSFGQAVLGRSLMAVLTSDLTWAWARSWAWTLPPRAKVFAAVIRVDFVIAVPQPGMIQSAPACKTGVDYCLYRPGLQRSGCSRLVNQRLQGVIGGDNMRL